MAKLNLGDTSVQLQAAIDRTNALGTTSDQAAEKVRNLQGVEEREAAVERTSGELRNSLAEATERLTSEIRRETSVLQNETAEWNASNVALERNLTLRRQLAGVIGGIPTGAAVPIEAAPVERVAPTVRRTAPVVTPFAASNIERPQSVFAAQAASERAFMLRQQEAAVAFAGQYISAAPPPPPQRLALPPGRQPLLLGPGPPIEGSVAGASTDEYRTKIAATTADLEHATAAQQGFSREVNAAAAAYAQSSNALSRHGALTTEFIQALSRGDVTLREFSSQMVSTIGKFGGWLVAGAAIYGVVKIFEDIKNGAVETQNAITTLSRFIPGLGGPAGGGSGQVAAAEGMLRSMATQFNVPISEVADAMQVVARTFHDLADAGAATQAVLAATKLDQVPVAQATQYLIGISQSMGWQSGGQLNGLMNSLNALQSGIGARVSQTLPAIARAAPAAAAGGVDIQTVELLSALGVRAGIPGAQVGTALTRTLGSYIFRPGSSELFSLMGIQPSNTSAQGPVNAVLNQIALRSQEGRPFSGIQLRAFANAFSTPQLGQRTFAPIFEEISRNPSILGRARQEIADPRPYTTDLQRQLQSVSERFQSLGIALGNFGSELSHVSLAPIGLGISVIHTFITAISAAATPIAEVGRLFDDLGKLWSPLQTFAVALATAAAGVLLYRRTFVGTAAQNIAGRLAMGDEWQESPRSVLRGMLMNARNVLQPEAEAASRSARQDVYQRTMQLQAAQARAPVSLPIDATAVQIEQAERGWRDVDRATDRLATATNSAADADYRLAQILSDIDIMSGNIRDADGNRLGYAQRAAIMQQRESVGIEQGVNIRAELNAEAIAQLAAMKGGAAGAAGGGGGGGGGGAATEAVAGAMVAATAIASNLMGDPATVANLTQDFQQSAAAGGAAAAAAGRTRQFVVPPGGLPEEQQVSRRFIGVAQGASEEMDFAAAAAFAAGGTGAAAAAEGAATRGAMQDLRGAVGTFADKVESFGNKLSDKLTALTPGQLMMGAPFAALMASQMLPIGQGMQNVIGTAAGGAIMGQLVRRGPEGLAGGITFGNVLGAFGQSPLAGGLTSGAGAAGFAVGSLLGGGFDPVTGLIGSAIATTAANALESITGVGQAAKAADPKQITQTANQTENDLQDFGQNFSDNLAQAFSGTTAQASNAQNLIQRQVEDLQSKAFLFGPTSPQGKQAVQEAGQVINAAIGLTTGPGANFAGAYQVIQQAISAQQQVATRMDPIMKWSMDPNQIANYYAQAIGIIPQRQYSSTTGPFPGMTENDINTAIGQANADISKGHAAVRTAQRKGLYQQQYDFAGVASGMDPTGNIGLPIYVGPGTDPKTTVQRAQDWKNRLEAYLKGTILPIQQILDAINSDTRETLETNAIQYSIAPTQMAAQLAESETNNPVTAASEAVASDAAQLKTIHDKYRTKTPKQLEGDKAYQKAISDNAAQDKQDRLALGQAYSGYLQSVTAVAESAVPSVDPVQRAVDALKGAHSVWQYMITHVHQFSTTDINNALATVEADRQGLADASYSFQSESISANEALNEALAREDPSRIAAVQGAAGRQQLAIARNKPQRNQAQATIVNSQNASVDASRTWAQDQEQFNEAMAHGDAALVAAAQHAGALTALGLAQNPYEREQALTQLVQSNTAAIEAARATTQAQNQLTQAYDTGDTVKAAQDAVTGANNMLRQAQTQAEHLSDLATKVSAQKALITAWTEREVAIGQEAASQTADPAQQAEDALVGAQKALQQGIARGAGKDTLRTLRTNVGTALTARNQANAQEQEANINFMFQMMEIPASAAVAGLQQILKMTRLAPSYRQQLQEEIRRYQLGQETPIGGGAFDLAPGNIRLPTFYDVFHGIGGARRPAMATRQAVNASTQINVYVAHSNDVPKVADAIDRATGAHLKQKLRAAGVR